MLPRDTALKSPRTSTLHMSTQLSNPLVPHLHNPIPRGAYCPSTLRAQLQPSEDPALAGKPVLIIIVVVFRGSSPMPLQVQAVLSDGTGNFDEERLLQQLPKDLHLPETKVRKAVEEQAKDRKRTTLVQAVSYLRQRKMEDTVKALNNMVACNKVRGQAG